MVRDMTGFDSFGHVLNELRRSGGVKMLSLGSDPEAWSWILRDTLPRLTSIALISTPI
jgi:hypothetical protein